MPSSPSHREARDYSLALHAFTATGVLVGMAALVAVLDGSERLAIIWLLVAQLIDGIAKTIQDEGRTGLTKPSSMLARLVRYGFVRFDPATFDYVNERSQEA